MLKPMQSQVTPGMRIFIRVWFGQLVSLTGSGLTGFALGIWVYQRTGSATQFALISLFVTLPGILISPLAGALVDRWNRRRAMLISDTGAAIVTSLIALLAINGQLEIWHIYLATAITSTFNAFQWPAYTAAISLLVPQQHFARASGMTQLAQALSHLVSPVLGGILFVTVELQGIILLDLATFCIALITLLSVRFPDLQPTPVKPAGKKELWREAAYGWHYIIDRPGLLGLLILFAISNFLVGMVTVLVTPLALSFTSVTVLGSILSIGGLGMLTGSLAMSIWGGPQRLVHGVFVFLGISGICIIIAGLYANVPVLTAAAFLFLFSVPIVGGCSQAIWQKKVAPEVQGRVFAMRRMIALSALPLAYLVAGPLADYVFEPLMAANGYLAGSLGQIIGVGPGRGIGLLLILLGILTLFTAVVASRFPHLRGVEDELPDAQVKTTK